MTESMCCSSINNPADEDGLQPSKQPCEGNKLEFNKSLEHHDETDSFCTDKSESDQKNENEAYQIYQKDEKPDLKKQKTNIEIKQKDIFGDFDAQNQKQPEVPGQQRKKAAAQNEPKTNYVARNFYQKKLNKLV